MRQPATMEDFTLADLPDLSDWRFVPILSLEQAALLWGGIDPAFIPTFAIAKQRAHPLQYRRANIALQAFLGGIVLKTLTMYTTAEPKQKSAEPAYGPKSSAGVSQSYSPWKYRVRAESL